jgi:hypothetical protein
MGSRGSGDITITNQSRDLRDLAKQVKLPAIPEEFAVVTDCSELVGHFLQGSVLKVRTCMRSGYGEMMASPTINILDC